MSLSQQLRKAMEATGQSTRALARAANIAAPELEELQRGNDIPLSVAERLAAYLKLELLPSVSQPAEKLAAENPAVVRQAARKLAKKVGTNLNPQQPKPLG